jgi:hypothetical protein
MYLLLPQCTHNESCPYFETLKNKKKNFIYESPNGLNHCIKWTLPLYQEKLQIPFALEMKDTCILRPRDLGLSN